MFQNQNISKELKILRQYVNYLTDETEIGIEDNINNVIERLKENLEVRKELVSYKPCDLKLCLQVMLSYMFINYVIYYTDFLTPYSYILVNLLTTVGFYKELYHPELRAIEDKIVLVKKSLSITQILTQNTVRNLLSEMKNILEKIVYFEYSEDLNSRFKELIIRLDDELNKKLPKNFSLKKIDLGEYEKHFYNFNPLKFFKLIKMLREEFKLGLKKSNIEFSNNPLEEEKLTTTLRLS